MVRRRRMAAIIPEIFTGTLFTRKKPHFAASETDATRLMKCVIKFVKTLYWNFSFKTEKYFLKYYFIKALLRKNQITWNIPLPVSLARPLTRVERWKNVRIWRVAAISIPEHPTQSGIIVIVIVRYRFVASAWMTIHRIKRLFANGWTN